MSCKYEFSRPVNVNKLSSQPRREDIEASSEECKAIAKRLEIPRVMSLKASYQIEKEDEGCFLARGHLQAQCERVCVVTLKAFQSDLADTFTVRFIPQEAYQKIEASLTEEAIADDVDILPYESCYVNLGEATVQQLSLICDPYPHAPDVHEKFQLYIDEKGDRHAGPPPRERVFSILSRLKQDR